MSDTSSESYTAVLTRLDGRLDALAQQQDSRFSRLEDKIDVRLTALDAKGDATVSRLDRLEGKLEGSLGMIRWLGPTGVVAVGFAIAKAAGLL